MSERVYLVKVGAQWLDIRGLEWSIRSGTEEYRTVPAGKFLGPRKTATKFKLASAAHAACFNGRITEYRIVQVHRGVIECEYGPDGNPCSKGEPRETRPARRKSRT